MTPTAPSSSDPPAARLAAQARQGDEDAFAALVRLYADRLYRFVRARGLSDADAEDCVQETFIKAHGALDRYDPDRPFGPWLLTIGARTAVDFQRRRRPSGPLPDDLAGGADPAAASAARDQTATVWREVERLVPRAQFEALWLFYAEDLSVSAIARVLARSEALVKVQLFRARRRLATELAPELRPAGVTGRAVAENSEAGPAGFGASPEGEST